jgi:hypothetical protein
MQKMYSIQFLKNAIINQDYGSPSSGIGETLRFWPSYLGSLMFVLPTIFKLFGFQSFDFETT